VDVDVGMVLRTLVALAAAWVILKVGFSMLRGLARPIPPPPPAGEMRKVNIRFRCTICGTELKMLLANDEEPQAPRHCQEDMQLVAPVME
jgi:hypothetical protein